MTTTNDEGVVKIENGQSTVDVDELEHFSKLSSRWWGVKTGMHTMNEVRVPLIRDGLTSNKGLVNSSKPLINKIMLDVGCGGGILSEDLARLGGIVHGIDPSPESIEVARQHAASDSSLTNLKYFVGTIEEHAKSNFEKYDAVIASEVLEHVTHKEMFLEACVRCVKPGGSVFITTFNKTISSWLISVVLIQEILNVIPRGTHTWSKFVSPDEVEKILDKYDCKTVTVKGLAFHFMSKTWSWKNDTATNYALQAIKKINY